MNQSRSIQFLVRWETFYFFFFVLHVNPFFCRTKSTTQNNRLNWAPISNHISVVLFAAATLSMSVIVMENYILWFLFNVSLSECILSADVRKYISASQVDALLIRKLRIIIYFGKTSEFSIDRNAEERSSLVCVIIVFFSFFFFSISKFGFHSIRSFHILLSLGCV